MKEKIFNKTFDILTTVIFILGIIIGIIIICLSIADAQEDTTCSANECQDIKCDNFVWVEKYIKNNTQNYSTQKMDIVNILKNTNYNIQDELNVCKKELDNNRGYKFAGIISFIISIILVIFIILILKKNDK